MAATQFSQNQATICLEELFQAANSAGTFGFIQTLLRVDGQTDADWDPFQETLEAVRDLRWHMDAKAPQLSAKSAWRMGLLAYCHLCEASALHATLANMLRLAGGLPYSMTPFMGDVQRRKKLEPWRWVPPSAAKKWTRLREWAEERNFPSLADLISRMYRDDIRNAFSHSDYILTDDGLRWTEGGPAQFLELQEVANYVTNAFHFTGAFLATRRRWLEQMGRLPTYRRLPNYEVLEIIRASNGWLAGFRLHFSNGSSACYVRDPSGCVCENISIEADGTIRFMCGSLEQPEPRWRVGDRTPLWDARGAANELA